MRFKIKPCTTVGGAFMVVSVSKFGTEKTMAIGLTEFEAKCHAVRLKGGAK